MSHGLWLNATFSANMANLPYRVNGHYTSGPAANRHCEEHSDEAIQEAITANVIISHAH
jgi:hypothetical protein